MRETAQRVLVWVPVYTPASPEASAASKIPTPARARAPEAEAADDERAGIGAVISAITPLLIFPRPPIVPICLFPGLEGITGRDGAFLVSFWRG